VLYRVLGPQGVLHLRARPDHGGPAWARVAGSALEHLERAPARRDWLRDAAARLEGGVVEEALAAAFEGCTVEALPTLPDGVVPPRWRLRMRTGGPGAPWPFDPELCALELGLRRALKREAFDEDEARADVAWLQAHGLAVRRVGEVDRDGRRTILAAHDRQDLEVLGRVELTARRGDAAAVEELGGWLGYPPCCVEAFAALGPRDDALSFALRLADPRDGPVPPELVFLSSALALVSHLPCEPRCPRTLEQARAVRGELARRAPSFDEAWHALAARVHVIDAEGRTLALQADSTGRDLRVRDALELRVDAPHVVARPELAGRLLSWAGRQLVGPGPEGVLVADHRAARDAAPASPTVAPAPR
jgi:hypothetical protein